LLAQIRESTAGLELNTNYNVFRTLQLSNDETRLHSRLIADLLNPYGQHDEGDKYLKLFLTTCSGKKELLLDMESIRVNTEYQIKKNISDSGSGRIDILITSSDYAIAIENKIYAYDQPNQLYRYSDFLKRLKNEEKKDSLLIYLSPNGKDATSESKQGLIANADYRIISYRREIKNWIEDCITKTINERLKISLQQYLEVITRLTRGAIIMDEVINLLFPDEKTVNLPELKSLVEILSRSEAIELSIVKKIINMIENQAKNILSLKKVEKEPNDSSFIRSYVVSENFGIRFKYTQNILFYGACKLNTKENKDIFKKLEKEGFSGQSKYFIGKKQTKITLSSNRVFPDDLLKEISEIANGIKILYEILISENTKT